MKLSDNDMIELIRVIRTQWERRELMGYCRDLLYQDPDRRWDYLDIDDGLRENIGEYYDFGIHMTLTPSVESYWDFDGYRDYENLVWDIEGFERVTVKDVYFYDFDGNEYHLDGEQMKELEDELTWTWS